MGFIELTRKSDGHPLLINTDQIACVRPDGAFVVIDLPNGTVIVSERFSHVHDAICAAGAVVVGAKGDGE